MAIMKTYPGLEVTIRCQEQGLPEYDNDQEEMHHNTLTKYIESRSEAEFAVQLQFEPPYPSHAIFTSLSLDGTCVGSRIIDESKFVRGRKVVSPTSSQKLRRVNASSRSSVSPSSKSVR
jgi:hypothetical protein